MRCATRIMNAFSAVEWLAVFTFVAGALLGLGAGWVLRSWRQADDAAPADERPVAPARAERPVTRASAPARVDATHPLELEEGAIGPMILLVDDRIEMLGIHAAYLRKHGYRTLLAENGMTGLKFARAYRPALIVLDHSMPDLTGVEVARELKADPATAGIPILLMTALSYGAVGHAAIEAGCAAFLPKPIEPSRLLREIEARTTRH